MNDASSITAEAKPPVFSGNEADFLTRANQSMEKAVAHLLKLQKPEGYWVGELEGDSILESEFILLKWIIREEDDTRLPQIANYLRSLQQPDGAWVQYPGAAMDLSATVKGYFALKLSGDDPNAPHMLRAKERIRNAGGAEKCNSFTKFYLAALNQISYDAVPSIPPEIVFLPKWFYFHLDKVSAWTRTMITPLSIVTTHRPVRKLSTRHNIDEIYVDQKERHRLVSPPHAHRTWSKIFLTLDRLLKLIHKAGMTPLRRRALQEIEDWIVEHTDRSDGLGAIFPPMVYILISLRARGYAPDHPILQTARKHLDDLMIHDTEKNEIRIQPCVSPIWDTGIAAYALTEAGHDKNDPAMLKCAEWLVAKECTQPGDWVANVHRPVAPSGWYFEFNNGFYPDVDDTAMVAMALRQIGMQKGIDAAMRGVDWILAMQNDDGGWAAFDRTVERPILEHIPFADHNAIQDPSCADITGRTLECLGRNGIKISDPAVQKALIYLKSKQFPEGCWFGRWGVNYVYGTWQAICGAKTIGVDMNEAWVKKAGSWLRSVQNEDGGFGESCDSYEDENLKGQGPSTPSQTAWGVMTLMAIFGADDPAVKRGIQWLFQNQLDNGSWEEKWFTGTGFPKVFYLRYHLYKLYFPVMCLGRFMKAQKKS